jgi:hypothetical protein
MQKSNKKPRYRLDNFPVRQEKPVLLASLTPTRLPLQRGGLCSSALLTKDSIHHRFRFVNPFQKIFSICFSRLSAAHWCGPPSRQTDCHYTRRFRVCQQFWKIFWKIFSAGFSEGRRWHCGPATRGIIAEAVPRVKGLENFFWIYFRGRPRRPSGRRLHPW